MALGKKTGGRKKGTPNRRTLERLALVSQAQDNGVTPLEVMMTAMRRAWEANDIDKAFEFAKDAAPYIHPKLAAVEHSGNQDAPLAIEVVSGVTRVIDTIAHDSDSDGAARSTH